MLKNPPDVRCRFVPPRATLLAALVLALLAPLAAHAEAQDGVAFERWYVLMLEGSRAGHVRVSVEQDGEHIVTTTAGDVAIRRGPMTIAIQQGSRFVETKGGEPVEAESSMTMGTMPMRKTMRFTDEELIVTTEQAGRSQTQRYPAPQEDWYPPAAAQRYIEDRIAAGDEKITLRTLDPAAGVQPFEMTLSVVGEEPVEVMGKVVPAIVWDAQLSNMPGVTVREYVDRHGRSVKTTMQLMPGMELVMLEADEQLATSPVDPPEMLASLFVKPDRPIDQPRELRSAVYELRLTDGPLPEGVAIPRAGYQRVVWGDQTTARVAVDLDAPVNPDDDLPTDEHLAASPVLDHADPAVQALVAEALGADADTLSDPAKAQRLRAFVHGFIAAKDLSVGMATASEVARTGQGDCSEHAVLLAAMLRAAGIPSRTASGLIYVDEFIGHTGVFGGHMWTQAWLPGAADGGQAGGRWVDLDATLPEQAFDAAHITLGVSSMSEQTLNNDLVELLPLLGSLDITLIEPAGTP